MVYHNRQAKDGPWVCCAKGQLWRGPRCSIQFVTLEWRHNGRDGVLNHQRLKCLPKGLCKRRSKKTSKLRAIGLCEGNPPVTGGFPSQRASNAENVSNWWRHHNIYFSRTMHHSQLAIHTVLSISEFEMHKMKCLLHNIVPYYLYFLTSSATSPLSRFVCLDHPLHAGYPVSLDNWHIELKCKWI